MNTFDAQTFCIISGGQTGVDRAALDAAMKCGVSVGGWCPEGRLAEDGPIDKRYPLKELKGGGYPERTLKNVVDSDGTAIIYFDELSGGTRLTCDYCINESRPYILINGTINNLESAVGVLDTFIDCNDIKVLNVAGPRASKDSRVYDYVYTIIYRLLKKLTSGKKKCN